MRNLGYVLLKYWIKIGLHLYYGKIVVSGLEKVPKDKPVMFLPNHQSALLDVLLLAVDCGRKPFFLTRSDVFKKPLLKRFFAYLQMIPIYRIRDGRHALKNNEAVFAHCASLLKKNQAILMFPEANHHIKRRVRPLSKGFTRILFGTLNENPELDIQMIPVGLNYKTNSGFPDQVAICFGDRIPVLPLYDKTDLLRSTHAVKNTITTNLKNLTTHIEHEGDYDRIEKKLDALKVDYLKPSQVNARIERIDRLNTTANEKKPSRMMKQLFKGLFVVLNLPVVLLWWGWIKPKVWEPEFTGTMRFTLALLAMPLFYLSLFLIITEVDTAFMGSLVVAILFIFNGMYVKFAQP